MSRGILFFFIDKSVYVLIILGNVAVDIKTLNHIITDMRKWTIIVENEFATSKPLVFVVTKKMLNITSAIVLSVLAVSLSVYGVAKMNNLDADALYRLQAQNRYLVSSLEKSNHYITSLIGRMDRFVSIEKKIRTLANLAEIPEDVRKLGIGGYDIEDKRISTLNTETKKMIGNLDSRLYQAKNVVDFEYNSIADVKASLEKHYDALKHKPSIMPTNGWVTSKFGPRTDPFTKKSDYHPGVDIANDESTPIYAPADGQVIFTGNLAGYGKVIKIDHGYGYITLYGHLRKILVKNGDKVTRHQKIALMGSTGKSTGPHLHYEVRIFNKKMDPFQYIDRDSIVQ